jgi:uncharacterized phage-associated protein
MFREDKATQMAARFLQLAGGRMTYLKLLKLLYVADKQMLLCWGKPIVYDRWLSTPYGPVLSATYDLIKTAGRDATYWSHYIKTDGYDVVLEVDPGMEDLSRAEERIIDDVFGRFGNEDHWYPDDDTHSLPEWEDFTNIAKELTYETVLEVEGLPADAIRDILDNIETQSVLPLALRNL